MKEVIATGYFGTLISGSSRSKVHLVTEGNKTLCGMSFKHADFQWCAHAANLNILECSNCRKIYNDQLQENKTKKKANKATAAYVSFNCSELGEIKVPFSQLTLAVDEADGDGPDLIHFRFKCLCLQEHYVTIDTDFGSFNVLDT